MMVSIWFSGRIPNVQVETRECSGCASSIAKCRNNVTLELFTLEKICDTSVTQTDPQTGITGNVLDFLFKTWWVTTRPPDVIFHMSAATHDMNSFNIHLGSFNIHEYQTAHREFFERLTLFTKSNKVMYFWSNSPRVWSPKAPEKWRNITTNDRVFQYNSVARDVVEQAMNKQIRLGLDLYTQSEGLNGSYYADGVHHIPEWYTSVGRQFINMYCTIVGEDQHRHLSN